MKKKHGANMKLSSGISLEAIEQFGHTKLETNKNIHYNVA
jgi:hypothetical protein